MKTYLYARKPILTKQGKDTHRHLLAVYLIVTANNLYRIGEIEVSESVTVGDDSEAWTMIRPTLTKAKLDSLKKYSEPIDSPDLIKYFHHDIMSNVFKIQLKQLL
jgi:hypothetical protein